MVAGIFLVRPARLASLDDSFCDIFTGFAGPGDPSGKIAIVEIDEPSLARFGRWPWPREVLAKVVKSVLDHGAATVALDMTLLGSPQSAPTDDEALASVLQGNPVVVGYAFRFDNAPNSLSCTIPSLPIAVSGPGEWWKSGFFHPSGVLCSAPQISAAAAGAGFLNAAPDADGRIRSLPLVMDFGDRQYPGFSLATVQAYERGSAVQLRLEPGGGGRLSLRSRGIPLEGRSSMRLRFRGPPRTFPYVSVNDLVDGGVSADFLRGKIVIVGGSAAGLPNPVATPIDPQFPEAEVQATAIDNLLQGDSFHRSPGTYAWECLAAFFAGVAAAYLLGNVGGGRGTLMALGFIAAMWALCAFLLWRTGLLLSPLPLTAVVGFVLPAVTLLHYRRARQLAEQTESQLASERETARDVLRESEARYRRLVENINDAIVVSDSHGRLTFANSRFREWFGLQSTDITQVDLERVAAPEFRASLRELLGSHLRGEAASDHCEFEGLRPDGSRIWIDALMTDIEEDGRIVGTQWALRDITARKQMEAQYLQAQKMESVGRLAGGVAHDFNNLLQVINGYTDLLLRGQPAGAPGRRSMEAIRLAGERAAELTRKLLSFSRKEQVKPAILDLNAAATEAAMMSAGVIGEDVEVITRLGPDLKPVFADPGQIQQILMNLVLNARDAMPRGGRIVIETKNVEADDRVYLGVTDTGLGMTDEVKRHLFEPFFTTKDYGKGTGLGLATVYAIVERSSGMIEVTSKLGEGTTFHIFFPAAGTDLLRQNSSKKKPVRNGTGRETVLLVEDEDSVRKYLRVVLEDSGYRVIEGRGGAEALELATHFGGPIHLLLTDIVMPQMNGRELADQLRLLKPQIKVLFISGYDREIMYARGIDAPDLAFLQKPFSPEELIAKVRESLGHFGEMSATV